MRASQHQGERGGAGGDEQDADVEQLASESLDEHARHEHPHDHAGDHRGQGQAGVDRRPPFAELAVQRHAEQQSAE